MEGMGSPHCPPCSFRQTLERTESRINVMSIQFLSETETESKTTHCCVCNRPYNEREYGWIYRAMYNVYTCSNECYTSDEYEMLLIEKENRKYKN